jgi:hypothetical protein
MKVKASEHARLKPAKFEEEESRPQAELVKLQE